MEEGGLWVCIGDLHTPKAIIIMTLIFRDVSPLASSGLVLWVSGNKMKASTDAHAFSLSGTGMRKGQAGKVRP